MSTVAGRIPHSSGRHSNKSAIRRSVVAAICFRFEDELEFLLVRTRAGRWTFPKGGVDGDRSFAAAAAREAYEEAGVRGRVDPDRFIRYRDLKPNASREVLVDAHLCKVIKQGNPPESHRNPTWFRLEKAKRRLREGRPPRYASELERVVDRVAAHLSPNWRHRPASRSSSHRS